MKFAKIIITDCSVTISTIGIAILIMVNNEVNAIIWCNVITCQGLGPWTWYGLSIYNSLYKLLLLSLFDYVRIIKLIFTVHCLVVLGEK